MTINEIIEALDSISIKYNKTVYESGLPTTIRFNNYVITGNSNFGWCIYQIAKDHLKTVNEPDNVFDLQEWLIANVYD